MRDRKGTLTRNRGGLSFIRWLSCASRRWKVRILLVNYGIGNTIRSVRLLADRAHLVFYLPIGNEDLINVARHLNHMMAGIRTNVSVFREIPQTRCTRVRSLVFRLESFWRTSKTTWSCLCSISNSIFWGGAGRGSS